ncbi:Transposase DDE domain-containing protein [Micromonospora eburnea]|uniref:Transposase DDE domain-containing protein n=1 Tax=Micromonospora eburnea TaxID=227316 RepID=A0A1C6V009_9ACTN|nr:Transposase DDE domain-containing protein [Micromonospora eburnea]
MPAASRRLTGTEVSARRWFGSPAAPTDSRSERRGRPRARPDHVIADKGYAPKAVRADLRRRGIGHTIPERVDQQANRRRRGSRGGRPPAFDKQLYKHRNVVEHCFNRPKQCRSVATRYDKTASYYHATVAALLQWL